MRLFTILTALFFVMISGLFAQKMTPQKGGNCFTLDIPAYMTKTFNLNDVASLQYHNIHKEAYTIVIEDNKEHLEFLGIKFVDADDFLKNFIESYMVDAENRKTKSLSSFEENSNKHAQLEMTWDQEGNRFYMLVTVVESKTHFYKILCWTLDEYKDSLKPDFLKIAKSLKE
ncbi:hypothetical protein MASR1M45_21210 [Candidatus Kapaibacterium sp.]